MQNNTKFAELRYSKRIWAIGSIHSHLESFESIKKHILNNFSNGDRLVFLGNIIGLGNNPKETLTSAINLRNILLSKFFLNKEDIIFLRGAQEEMFLKLLQLHTEPNPSEIITWMFEHGVNKTLLSMPLILAQKNVPWEESFPRIESSPSAQTNDLACLLLFSMFSMGKQLFLCSHIHVLGKQLFLCSTVWLTSVS